MSDGNRINPFAVIGVIVLIIVSVLVVVPYVERHTPPAPGAPSAPVVEAKKPEPRIEELGPKGPVRFEALFKDRETGTEIACFRYGFSEYLSCVKL